MNRPIHGGNLVWAAALADCPPDLIVDFSASINPLGPPKGAITAIQNNLKALTAYPDPNYSDLRTALSQIHQISPDWILPGNGSAELLTWAGWDFSTLTATHLFTPAFSDYWRALRAFNIKVVEWGIGNGELGIGNPKLQLPNSSQGLLLNNPHNPTGKLFSKEALLPYLEQFALVVVDEAFMDFLPPHEQQSLISVVQDHQNLVILRSLTKFYSLPGLRLGYAIAHPERLRSWQQRRDPWAVNTLAAAAGVVILQDQEFQHQTWEWLPIAREKLWRGLAALPGLKPYPSAANFLLVHTQESSSKLQEKLLKQSRILIRDCLSFPELGDNYFRVAVRSEEDNQRLINGLAKILK